MNKYKRDAGFTLVELMVVVLIIGILVAIAVPIFNAAKGSAQQKSCWANERHVEGAYQTYQAGSQPNGQANPPLGSLAAISARLILNSEYIKDAPGCPAGGNYTINAGAASPQDANGNYIAIQLTCDYAAGVAHGTHP